MQRFVPKKRRNINGDWIKEDEVWIIHKDNIFPWSEKYYVHFLLNNTEPWEQVKNLDRIVISFTPDINSAYGFKTSRQALEFISDAWNNPDKYELF